MVVVADLSVMMPHLRHPSLTTKKGGETRESCSTVLKNQVSESREIVDFRSST